MKYRPTLPFVIVITALLLLAIAGYLIGAIALYNQSMKEEDLLNRVTSLVTYDYRPDVSHCLDNDPSTDIWCCITNKEAPCLQ